MQRSECYRLLGLEPGASRAEIRKQYRMLAMRYHPDRNQDPDAEKLFILITEAYTFLLEKPVETKAKPTVRGKKKAPYEERMKTANERFAEQKIREQEENDRYFNYLTKSRKWKTIRVGTYLGVFLAALLLLDFFLPHHYEEDEITQYHLDVGLSPTGKGLALVGTAQGNYFFVSNLRYNLYAKERYIFVETSWIFHNPIRLISNGKLERLPYSIHFHLYGIIYFFLLILLIPLVTMNYQRKSLTFTLLYHASYFGTSAAILAFLLSGHRWAHLLTLGFL